MVQDKYGLIIPRMVRQSAVSFQHTLLLLKIREKNELSVMEELLNERENFIVLLIKFFAQVFVVVRA